MNMRRAATEIPGAKIDAERWKSALKHRQGSPVEPWSEAERAELLEFNQQSGAGDLALEGIGRLGEADTLVVIGGQQAGLFLSPMLILYKALAVVQWAGKISAALDRAVVPMFWIASEDHDFEEVRVFRYLDKDGGVADWRYLPTKEPAAGRSVFDIDLDREVLREGLSAVQQAAAFGEHGEDVFGFLNEAVDNSRDLEDLFARVLMHLLGSSGLVLIPSRLPALRNRARVVLQKEIENPGRSTALVKEAIADVESQGGKAALHRKGNEANFFLYRDGLRCAVSCDGRQFQVLQPASGEVRETISEDALLAELQRRPENFSPNVVTRPIIQDLALPTIAMIAGPSEERYLELLQSCFSFFDVAAAKVLRRPRALLVEPRIERLLKRFALEAGDLEKEDWAAVEETVLREGKGARIEDAIENLSRGLKENFDQFAVELDTLADQNVVREAIEKTLRSNLRNLGKLEHRLVGEMRSRRHVGQSQWEKLKAALCPEGLPQERMLWPFSSFLSSLGPRFVPWLQEELDVEKEGLQVLMMRSAWQNEKTDGEK